MTALEKTRQQLLDRREQLAEVTLSARESQLVDLLRQVDNALERLDTSDWGRCTACDGRVEPERLTVDPLLRVCLDCLTPDERRSLELDLETAARVQAALLPPREIRHRGWEAALLWEPLGPVSGDHYDMIVPTAGDEPLHLIVGDVAGKGVAASLVQSHLHAILRALSDSHLSLAASLERANCLLCAVTLPASYATLLAARLYPDGRVELASAGHPRPLLADRRGVRPIEGAGLPLGLFRDSTYTTRELHLEPGDTLVFYTDGWTEATNDDGEFGIGRAAAAVRCGQMQTLPELLAGCRADMEAFLGGEKRGDDLTVLAVRRTSDASTPWEGRH
jgi:sigma-B regulation protein RsbU (phosphoserine phosphatase)